MDKEQLNWLYLNYLSDYRHYIAMNKLDKADAIYKWILLIESKLQENNKSN